MPCTETSTWYREPPGLHRGPSKVPRSDRQTCEEEDTCMPYEEEDTCMSYEEEDTCMSYEEDTGYPEAIDRPFHPRKDVI